MLAVPMVFILTYSTIILTEFLVDAEKQLIVDDAFLSNFFNPEDEPCHFFTFDAKVGERKIQFKWWPFQF